MIPGHISTYLEENDIPFRVYRHPRAITAQELAQALHITGHRVAKAVLVEADGQRWIAVLPAPEQIDLERLARAVGASHARLLTEGELPVILDDCEHGATPPFGRLYGIPVVVDRDLGSAEKIIFHAGSYEEALEMSLEDFLSLENPRIAEFATSQHWAPERPAPLYP